MPNPESAVTTWAKASLYTLALVLIAFPTLDLLTTILPLRPGDFQWRYGALGLTPGYVHVPLIGVMVAFAVAFWAGHRRTLRWFSVLALIAALAATVAMVVFALDVVQMRGMRPEVQRPLVVAGGILQEFKYFATALTLALVGVGGWGTSGRMVTAPVDKKDTSASPGIITGTGKKKE